MSLTSSLQRIVTAKENIRQSIIGKGVSVGADISIADYPDYIDNISVGGGSGNTQQKTVTLDLSGGDQIVLPDQDYTLSQVTITKPADLISSNIRYGITIAGVEGSLNVGVNPTLNAPSISRSNNTLTISNPSTNGNFNSSFKLFNSGVKVTEQSTTSLDLRTIASAEYVMTCRCSNGEAGFIDSADSNALTFTLFAFLDKTSNVDTSFDWENSCHGIALSFTITPKAGYYLPPKIDIFCNGKKLDYSYNPYTGAVVIDALSTTYAGTLSDMGKMATPTINSVDIAKATADVSTPAGCEQLVFNSDGTDCAPISNSEDITTTTVTVGISGVSTPKLVAPYISLKNDNLTVVDSFLKEGDVLYSEYYTLNIDGNIVASDIDATADQSTLISYEFDPEVQFIKQNDGSYKTATSSSYRNTYAWMRANLICPRATNIKVSYTFYPYNSYVRMYAGKLDQAFTKSVSTVPTSSQYQVASSGTGTTTNSYTLAVPAGTHFIDFIKQYNSTSTSSTYYNRYMQIKVEEVE